MTPTTNKRIRRASNSASPAGKSTGEIVRHSNRWRDNYNPLRNLVISRVVAMIEAAERGDFAELEMTVRKIEKRYPVLKGLKSRRLSALEELDWDIKVMDPLPPGANEVMAKKQQEHLRSRYDLVKNLTEAFGFLALAEIRGFSILQKHRYDEGPNDGAVRELHWLPQWNFSRAGEFGDWFYNKNATFGISGDACKSSLGELNRIGSEKMPRSEFVIREVDTPLYEIALIAFVNWSMGRKDYSAFVEIFGLPSSIIIMPPSIPSGKEDEYRTAAEKVADGVSGALPNGSDAKFPTASVRSQAPFKEFCDCQDADVVLAGTGGRLSMLTADKGGLGDGPSGEHADAFDQIARADARKINVVLQSDFDCHELDAAFEGQPHCVYFELAAEDKEDTASLCTNVATLKNAGHSADPDWLQEKTGYEFTEVEEVTPGNEPGRAGTQLPSTEEEETRSKPITNRDDSALRTPQSAFSSAIQSKVDVVGALVNRIVNIQDDAAMLAELHKFYDHADQLTALVTADVTRAANALEQITAPALVKGLSTP